jgi:hypothetical protein
MTYEQERQSDYKYIVNNKTPRDFGAGFVTYMYFDTLGKLPPPRLSKKKMFAEIREHFNATR